MTERDRVRSAPITVPPKRSSLRYILFGLECGFTQHFLVAMLRDDLPPVSVLLPGPPRYAGVLRNPSVSAGTPVLPKARDFSTLAATLERARIPCVRVGDLRSREVQSEIESLRADVLVTACFNRKIPSKVLKLMPFGGINVHPSLLPDLRGPDPLFWTFHRGDGRAGVTVHQMTDRLDAGPIYRQQPISLPDGTTESEAEQMLAEAGAEMTGAVLHDLVTEIASSQVQCESRARYARHPTTDDFRIPRDFTARRTYNFVRGLSGRGIPFEYESATGETSSIVDVIDFGHDAIGQRTTQHAGAEWLPVADGCILAVTASATKQ